MIDYKLAKQLKDAGFEQEGDGELKSFQEYVGGETDLLYIPTLSELINACENDFHNLVKTSKYWICNYNYPPEQKDKTPEEAVIKLYLRNKSI